MLLASNVNSDFNHKTFMIMKSDEQRCLFFPGEQNYGDTNIDDQFLVTGVCANDFRSRTYKNFTYRDNKIVRATNTPNSVAFEGYREMCATVDKSKGNMVVAKECGSKSEQHFDIVKHPSKIEGQYFFKNNGFCLAVTNSSSHMDYCDENNKDQVFDIVDIKDPVSIKLVNRGWFNMSFSVATRNNEKWRFWTHNPSWLALDGVRSVNYPARYFQNDSDYVTVYADFGRSVTLNNILPGESYEVQSHGTTFNKHLKVHKKQSAPQVILYDLFNKKGDKLVISQDQSNLTYFNDKISSYTLPEGWTVRFYTEPNYQGDYYTRHESTYHDSHIDNKIKSIKILSKG